MIGSISDMGAEMQGEMDKRLIANSSSTQKPVSKLSKVFAFARFAASFSRTNQLVINSMRNIEVPFEGTINRWTTQNREGRVGLMMLLALVVAIMLALLTVIISSAAEPAIIGLLAILAMFGVFFLLAGAVGLIGLQSRSPISDHIHNLVESASEGIQITAPDGSVLFTNPAFDALLSNHTSGTGATIENMLINEPQNSKQVFRLSRAAELGAQAEELIQFGQIASNDGSEPTQWYRVSVASLTGSDGNSVGNAWRVVDVTDSTNLERAEKYNAREIEKSFENIPVASASLNGDGTLIRTNAKLRSWIEKADIKSSQINIQDLKHILNVETASVFEERRLNTEPGKTFTINGRRRNESGASVPITIIYRAPDTEPEGHSDASLVIFEDERSLSPAKGPSDKNIDFSGYFHAAPFAIASITSDGAVESANHAFNRMFGRTSANGDTAAFSIIENISSENHDEVMDYLKTVLEGRTGLAPVDIKFGPKASRTGRFYMMPMTESGSNASSAILYAIDTTEQKTLEDQFAQSQKMQAVGQLAGGIAHDFNNVLTAIIGFSDLLLKNHRPTDPAFKDIINIKQNANRAAGLVRQLLAFSRRQTLRPEVLTLTDVISDLSILLSRLLGESVNLRLEPGRDLWYVKADLNQFEQVIVNLAVNARDAMDGSGSLEISTRNLSEIESADLAHLGIDRGEYVLCEITDTGSGIPEELMEKIFEPFFSTKEVGKGTGLGLSTVYGTIKQTGGYIFPESKLGEGTRFKIYLPRHIPDASALIEAEENAGIRAGKRPPKVTADLTGTGCVMLVEDEGAVRDFAVRALRSRGYEVLEAGSGIEALEVIEAHEGTVDLVVSDVVMPEMDGPTLLGELRQSNHDMKVIFMSGYAEDAFKKNLPEDEKFIFLPKPFSLQQLATTVKETIG